MDTVKIKYRTLYVVRDIFMSTSFVLLLILLIVDVLCNYGSDGFPKPLMKFSKEILILSLSLVLSLFTFMVFRVLKLIICFSKKDSPCEITNQGIYFYYDPYSQKSRSYIEWAKIKDIKLINRSVSGVKMNVIVIGVYDLDNYIQSCNLNKSKLVKKSLYNYKYPIAFSINGFDISRSKTFLLITEFWNEWKQDNQQ